MQRTVYELLFLIAAATPLYISWHSFFQSATDIAPYAAGTIVIGWPLLLVGCLSAKRPVNAPLVAYLIYFAGSLTPFLLALLYYCSAPAQFTSLLNLCALTSLGPFIFEFVWRLRLEELIAVDMPITTTLLAVLSAALAILAVELVGSRILSESAVRPELATKNSNDKSYWFYAGTQQQNSLGMYPTTHEGSLKNRRILVLGDSMPAAKREVNFVSVANDLLAKQCASDNLHLINAGMAGFSLKQIELFYKNKLDSMEPKPEIVVISFYLDDINRELRYRKGPRLYSPLWPEWMQDVYYRCLSCRSALNLVGFNHNEFQLMRSRDYRSALPAAYVSLFEIVAAVRAHGGTPVLLNVPSMNWSGALTSATVHRAVWFNNKIEQWAQDHGVLYADALQNFVGEWALNLTISASDKHLNDAGHFRVAEVLSAALGPLICSTSPSITPEGPTSSRYPSP